MIWLSKLFLGTMESNRQFSSAIFDLFYTSVLGGHEIQSSSMYFSAVIIKGAESDWLMCEYLL